MDNELVTIFFFLVVRARKSGSVVKALQKKYQEVQEVAAVYAETDVVVQFSAPQPRIEKITFELLSRKFSMNDDYEVSRKYKLDQVTPAIVEGRLRLGRTRNESDLRHNTCAYVKIEIDERQAPKGQIIDDIHETCDNIVYTASVSDEDQIIAKIKTSNKKAFDEAVMDQIQTINGVSSTRTLLIINEMHFVRTTIDDDVVNNSNPTLLGPAAWAVQRNRDAK